MSVCRRLRRKRKRCSAMADFAIKPEWWEKNSLDRYWLPMVKAQKPTAGGGASGLGDFLREEWLGSGGPVHSGPFPFPMAELDESSAWKPGIRILGLQNAVNFFYGLKGWTVSVPGTLSLGKGYDGAYYCLAVNRLQAVQSCMASADGLGGKWRSFRNTAAGVGLFTGKVYYEIIGGKRTGYVYIDISLYLDVYEKYKVHLGSPSSGGEATEEALLSRPLSIGAARPMPSLERTMFRKCRKMSMGSIEFELNLYDLCSASVYPDFPGWPERAVKENTDLWNVVDGLEFF